ncbi:hypothetical protein [Rhodococcus sp. NPDC004095]
MLGPQDRFQLERELLGRFGDGKNEAVFQVDRRQAGDGAVFATHGMSIRSVWLSGLLRVIEVDTRRFAVDPVLLHRLVSYCTNNPDARSELGADAAVTRARARYYPNPSATV